MGMLRSVVFTRIATTLAPARQLTVQPPAGAVRSWAWQYREELWIALILAVAALVHAFNMFHFPYYENDEGTYMSQAWALIKQGQLAPYTYWYDHAPMGWVQLAGWALLTGGFNTFGTTLESGRILMLLMQVGATFLVYRITRIISRSLIAATLAALLFAFTAYGLYYHRRILLDNMTTFWALLSVVLLLSPRLSLNKVWLSAVALGVSILSKELTIFLIPVLAYLVFYKTDKSSRIYATLGWVAITLSIFSGWVLMAILKNELFPTGTLLGGATEHVSLLGTLQYQTSRSKDGGLLDPQSGFWGIVSTWVQDEPLLVVGGSACALLSLLLLKNRRLVAVMGLVTLSLWAFLGRGGVVLGFYLVPLLAFLAINIGLLAHELPSVLSRGLIRNPRARQVVVAGVSLTLAGLSLVGIAAGYRGPNLGFRSNPTLAWTSQQADAQIQALDWVKTNLGTQSSLVIDQYIWTELHDMPTRADSFNLAHWYWKVERDPAIGEKIFHGDWRNFDYVLSTGQLENDMVVADLTLVKESMANSTPVVRWDTGGWHVELRRVNKLHAWPAASDPMLVRSWQGYKQQFIEGGRIVIDPQGPRQTTAEGQGATLLRAVYMDDRPVFDRVWSWTRANLQILGDGLLASRWGGPEGSQVVLDRGTSTSADQDAALALLFAARRWNAPAYQQQALEILRGIWSQETTVIANRRLAVAGNWARGDGQASNPPIVSPANLAPYAYRIFAEADPEHPWLELVGSTYSLLGQVATLAEGGGPNGLVPDRLALDPQSGRPEPASSPGSRARESSDEASRLTWNLTLDWLWFQSAPAKAALTALDFPRQQLARDGRLAAAYQLNGTPSTDREALSMYAANLGGLLVGGEQTLAHRVFAQSILKRYASGDRSAHWGDPNDFADQTWGWYATALMDGAASNLWANQRVVAWDKVIPGSGSTITDQQPS